MNCPRCGEKIFEWDAYLTEDRLKKLYNINNRAGQVKEELNILVEMINGKRPWVGFPPSTDWIKEQIIRTRDKIETLGKED